MYQKLYLFNVIVPNKHTHTHTHTHKLITWSLRTQTNVTMSNIHMHIDATYVETFG